MMKKLIAWIVCAVMLMSSMVLAQAEPQQQTGSAVDIVLLIDQSGSTWSKSVAGGPSDPNGYRLDAAEMVIALLGMNGSRVAYVPFAARVFENADSGFSNISGPEDYRAKMAECEKLRGNTGMGGAHGENEGGTDYAEALAYAYNLLAKREDDSNQPMIIFLTDGKIEFTGKQQYLQKQYYTWNANTGLFDKTSKAVRVYLNRESASSGTYFTSELLESAVTACVTKEFPVYTVALASDRNSEFFQELNDISVRTGGGNAIAIGKNDIYGLESLPAYFGKMFANRIGSSELKVLSATCVDPATNLYEVQFVIPNKSVMEANLFVSKVGVSGSYLLDADGNRPSPNTVTELSSHNFVLYKLNNPTPYGIWKLRFTKTDDRSASDISFNLLYNYDVVLHGYVNEAGGYEGQEAGATFSRGDVLAFSAKFYDNREGRLSVDSRLYDYPDVPNNPIDDWCTMNVSYELRQVLGNQTSQVVYSSADHPEKQMVANGNQFYVELDMKDIKRDINDFNGIAAGEYFMDIRVEGSGLVREVNVPFTLTNTPASNNVRDIEKSFEVDAAPGDDVGEIDLSSYIYDADNDRLSVTFAQDAEGSEHVTLSYDRQTQKLSYQAIPDGEGKHASCTGRGMLRIVEVDQGTTTEIPVKVHLTSANDELAGRWIPQATVEGSKVAAVVSKDTDFEIKLQLMMRDNPQMIDRDTSFVNKVKAEISIEDSLTYESIATGEMDMASTGVFTFQHHTGVKSGAWTVNIRIKQKENDLVVSSATTNFMVENAAPTANHTSLAYTIYHNPLPEFLSILGTATPEEERSINLEELFTETDKEALVFVEKQGPSVNLLTIDKQDPVWVLSAVEGANASTTFMVSARDNDGAETPVITFEVELVDLVQVWSQRGLIALAALIVLIIIILLIRQARKPKFPKGAVLGVREGSSDYDTSTYEFVPSKKPIPLAAVIMSDTAAKFGIGANALTNIELVPVRSTNGSIGVRIKKRMDDVTVALTSKTIGKGKKPTIWAVGDTLILNSRNNMAGAELNVVLSPAENMSAAGTVFGSSSNDDDPFQLGGGFNSNVNAFGANDPNGAFGSFTPSESFTTSTSGSNDGGFTLSQEDKQEDNDPFKSSSSNDDFSF